ncbi:MAG: TolC family protein [Candidatus Eremiobacteraeota bacterium]|nr:TolC family protein [Candidatus Eremiobacteraeota bacterium]MCW5870550.1 TolC family protein [Candidatus Eremiobacteraeota bacterium]
MIRYLLALLLSGELGAQTPFDYRQAVDTALRQNLTLQSQELEPPQAQARLEQARAQRNPTFSLTSTYLHQADELLISGTQNLNSGLPQGLNQRTALSPDLMLNRFALAVPVYTGGRLESAMHERKALLEAEQSGLERNRQLTSQSARLNYLQSLLARENLEVSLMNLKEASHNLAIIKSRHQAGVATRFDLMQAETALANGQEQLARSQADWERQQVRLSEVLNAPLETRYDLKESLLAPEPLLRQETLYAQDLPTLSERALARRPELNQLRARIQAVQEQRNGAESGLKPSFFVSLNYDFLGNPSQLQNGWSLLASLAIPLWDGGLTEARVSELDTRELQLQTEEKRQLQRIGVEVKESYLTLQEAEQRLLAAAAAQNAAREAVRVGRLRYDVGAATSLELISAQSSLTAASFALAEARFRQLSARVAINTAVGEEATR